MNEGVNRTGDFIARYRCEEFVVILPNTDAKGASVIAEQFRANVEAKHIAHAFSSISDYVSISLGIATMMPDSSSAPENLITKADEALYNAQEALKN